MTTLRGLGCERVLEARGTDHDYLCGRPSRFAWWGFDPNHLGLTAAQRRKYIRTRLLLCIDCTLDIMFEWGWHIKDQHARLERLDMYKHRAHCSNCGLFCWVAGGDWEGLPTSVEADRYSYCPKCGARTLYYIDAQLDVWEVMFNDFMEAGTPLPQELIKLLHTDWPRDDRRFHRFYDYVRHQLDVFTRTGDFEVV